MTIHCRVSGVFATWIACAIVMTSVLIAHSLGVANNKQPGDADDWSQLNASMDKMHMAIGAIERSGDADVDFVRLMLPHHQGAIDMAKVQLLHGKDPQMRRLAQEIITDQQLEIELMQRWLKAHVTGESKENGKSAAAKKDK
jgi:uncharacterized protein (DUF305 family)